MDGVVQHPRGKLLGGCSAINVQILAYPSRAELDALIELGISGWDWETIAPYYRKFHTPCASHEEGQDIQQNLETGLAQSSGTHQDKSTDCGRSVASGVDRQPAESTAWLVRDTLYLGSQLVHTHFHVQWIPTRANEASPGKRMLTSLAEGQISIY